MNSELPTGFLIRWMSIPDLPNVRSLDSICFPSPWPKGAYEFELKQKKSRCWVLEYTDDQGKKVITGILVIFIILDEAQIATFAIHPEFRNKGLGREFLKHGLLTCKKEQVETVFLEVRHSNLPAQNLYTSFGFITVNTRKGYYANGEDAFLMNLYQLQQKKLLSI